VVIASRQRESTGVIYLFDRKRDD